MTATGAQRFTNALLNYQSTEGQAVAASFFPENNPGVRNDVPGVVLESALLAFDAAGLAALRAGSRGLASTAIKTTPETAGSVAAKGGGDAVVPRIGTVNNPNGVRLSANEQAAADALKANGYDVTVVRRDLGAEGVRRSDFTVDGFGRVDEYTPTNPTQNTVVRGVVDKIGDGQADSVIVNVPSDFSNFDMYSSAVRVFNNPSASNANTLFFLQNGQLRQFDRSVVNNLTGAN